MKQMTMKEWLRQQIAVIDDHVIMSLEFQAYIVKNRHINHVQFKDDFGELKEITITPKMREEFAKNIMREYKWGN